MESGDISSAVQVLESAVAESPTDTNLKATLEQALALQALRQKETEELDSIREEEAQTRKYETELERQRRENGLQQQQAEARVAIERQQAELEGRRKQAEARRLEHQAEIERQDAELARQRKEVESKLRQRLEEDTGSKQEVESATPERPQGEGKAPDQEPSAIEPVQATVIVAATPAPAPITKAKPAVTSDQATKLYELPPEPQVETAPLAAKKEPGGPRPRVPIRSLSIAAAVLVVVAAGALVAKRWWAHRPPPQPQQFLVKIESTPPHAHIQIKGLNITCETPCGDLRLAPGRYEMEATLNQYQPSTQAVQVPDQAGGVLFSLNPLPPVEATSKPTPPVNLTIRTSPGATVTVDDKPYKTKSDGTVKAEVASNSAHAVHVQKDGFKAVDQSVPVAGKNMEVPVRLEAMPDAVTILVKKAPPTASILVDGSHKATVAKDGTARFQVPSGTHSFALSTSNGTAPAISHSPKAGEKLVLDNLPVPVAAAKPSVDTTDADWNKAKDTNDQAELQTFVDRHPASAYADSAKNRIDQLDWNSASSSGSRSKLLDYQAKHPSGQFAQQCRDELDGLDWKDVQSTNDVAKLQEFIDLHPKSKFRSAAADKIASLSPKPTAPVRAVDDDPHLIQKVLDAYREAYQDKDKMRLRRVWPGLTDKDFDRINTSFRDAESIQVALKVKQGPIIDGTSAHVTCDQLIKVKVQGSTQSLPTTQVFTLKKDTKGGDWYIEKVATSK